MLIENKQIAIVGGGPGGLTLARLLQLQGATVKVYERDVNKDARVQGSPLDLHDASGLAAICEAGLLNEFKQHFLVGADKKMLVNEMAEIFFSDHETKTEEHFGDPYFRPEIDRGALRKILLDSLQPETVVWDSHFTSMQKQDEGWLLHFKSSPSVYADVVVAADGARSKIRPYITGLQPFYSGITMLEGNVYDAATTAPGINALLKGGKIMAFGNEQCLLMGTKGNGDIGFYASLKTGEDWAANNGLDYTNNATLLAWFKKQYPGWGSVWNELFETAATPFIPRPIYCMPLNQQWEALPNLTMLGDAAHVMPPFAGEGANMAMLDALELARCCTTTGQHATLQEAIAFYEKDMCQRAATAAQQSLENGERMHSPTALADMLQIFGSH
jgi:2-polyprenyl-6-methoxyphenol hydroxylase-like FAD-dependent oxidoreductase